MRKFALFFFLCLIGCSAEVKIQSKPVPSHSLNTPDKNLAEVTEFPKEFEDELKIEFGVDEEILIPFTTYLNYFNWLKEHPAAQEFKQTLKEFLLDSKLSREECQLLDKLIQSDKEYAAKKDLYSIKLQIKELLDD